MSMSYVLTFVWNSRAAPATRARFDSRALSAHDPSRMTASTRKRSARRIQPPDPDLPPRQLTERVIALRPLLRERQAETEANRRVSDDTNRYLVEAGCYRCLQPRRFGGYEFDLPTFARMAMEVARGCP